MKSTALGAENIIFISDAHEKFYYEKLQEVRYQDVYHKALCYCLGEYYGAAEPPVRCGESHLSGLTEPPHFVY